MFTRVRLGTRLGTLATARLASRHVKPSIPAITRLCSNQPVKTNDETPEFGKFFKDVSELLHSKTGETGKITLGAGLAAYILSKEILVIHEETVLALVLGGTVLWLIRLAGKGIAEYLDGYSQGILDMFNEGRDKSIQGITQAIEDEKAVEGQLACRTDIVEVMRENNAMSLELEYRNRLHEVAREVKKRLDYQYEIETLQRKIEQEHIIDWIERQVIKSITPQQEKESINQCIKDLKTMAMSS